MKTPAAGRGASRDRAFVSGWLHRGALPALLGAGSDDKAAYRGALQ